MGSPYNPLFSRDLRAFLLFGVVPGGVKALIYKGVREMPLKSRDSEGGSWICVGIGL